MLLNSVTEIVLVVRQGQYNNHRVVPFVSSRSRPLMRRIDPHQRCLHKEARRILSVSTVGNDTLLELLRVIVIFILFQLQYHL